MPKAVIAVLCVFCLVMIGVIFFAYSRKSGNTGLDMGKMQQLRYSNQLAQPS